MKLEYWRHYAQGRVWRALGRPDAACSAFCAAMAIDPLHTGAVRHLAAMAAEREQWEVAAAWFARVVDLAPDDADAWFNLGFVHERAGNAPAAISAFTEALKHKPSLDRARYGMGLAHARLGQHRAAAAAFGDCVDMQPLHGEAYYQWGMALHYADCPQDVRRVIERLAQFEPQRARQLLLDTQHTDLLHLIPELPI